MKTNHFLEYARKMTQAYEKVSKPLCNEIGMPQTAFDILMFLANNPSCNTAGDIVEIRRLKANLVSINVDKLVKEGFLIRKDDAADRRRVILVCTKKADPVIQKGRKMQKQLYEQILSGISQKELDSMHATMEKMIKNIDEIRGEQV